MRTMANNQPARRASKLISAERLSPNCSKPRNKKIRKLTPHCVAGNLSINTILGLSGFVNYSTKNGTSSNYVIDSAGKIGLAVEEGNRPWTTSSSANDNEAITFEIANDGGAPDYHMSAAALNAWIALAVDICQFYGYKRVAYYGDKNKAGKDDEMVITLHRWYANKACPGDYFISQLPRMVKEINDRLAGSPSAIPEYDGPALRPVLKQGMSGQYVKEAQTKLNKHGADPALTVDGSFGPATNIALRAFQNRKKLVIDGFIGPLTWAELDKDVLSSSPFVPYLVKSSVPLLNVRSGPSLEDRIVRQLVKDQSAYTIIEESNGWGKLKSGAGWVLLTLVQKV